MNAKTYAVRVRERGQVTIPQAVRESLPLQDGDFLNLVQIGDVVVLTAREPRIPDLTVQFEAIMAEEGVTLADLLSGLEEEREASWRKRQRPDA